MSSIESTSLLLHRARAGDALALEALFGRYLPWLSRWASGRLPRWARDVSDTPDLVQDTLLQTFKRMDGFDLRGEGALRAYLRQAVMNRIRDQIRRRQRRGQPEPLDPQARGRSVSPLELAIQQQALERYDTALARLREEERELLVGRLDLGLSYEELAQAAGRPTAEAARRAAQRALLKLVEEMDRAGR
jgi:RNA polymerase sigma-70 factor (ECF subfamily)